jgi:RluA family pseudouridine synthase
VAAPVFLLQTPDVAAVDKAPGDLVIPDRFRKEGPTLFDRTRDALGGELFLVHRLDRETSGVLLFARTADAQRELSAAFEAGGVKKVYRAIVSGAPEAEGGRIDRPIAKGRKGRMVIREGGKPSVTAWALVKRFLEHGLVEARPETGRTHQIRVHLASIGHPISGDRRYDFSKIPPVAPRLALHAMSVSFRLGTRDWTIESPFPPDLSAALARLESGNPDG